MSSIPARRILSASARPCLRTRTAPSVNAAPPSRFAPFSCKARMASVSTVSRGAQQQTLRRRAWNAPSGSGSGSGVRWSTTSATGSKIWTFEEIQSLTTTPPPKATLIDVREPSELRSTGRIPGSVNIPITTAPDSFHLTADEFEDRFGFARPPKDAPVVFYCKAGVRSRAAAGIARDAGWSDVGEFPGSWIEWAEKGGAVER